MPKVNSYADILTDWQELLEAADRSADVQPSIEAERQSLAQLVAEVQGLKARRDEPTALRQQATQQLKAAVTRGKEVAIRVRSVVRGKIGPKEERLVHFRVAPIRKRPRKTKEPDGGKPGTQPGTPAPPSVKSVE